MNILKYATMALLATATISHATTETRLEQTDAGQQLVVVQKDALGRDVNMPPAQLGISPPKLDLSARSRVDASVTFYNYSDDPKIIEVSLIDVDENFQPIDSTKGTLKQWAVFAPQEFEMVGQGYQTIRLSFRLPANFPKKTHYAFLSINQKIDKPIVEQTDALTVVKIGSQYYMPIRLTVH